LRRNGKISRQGRPGQSVWKKEGCKVGGTGRQGNYDFGLLYAETIQAEKRASWGKKRLAQTKGKRPTGEIKRRGRTI